MSALEKVALGIVAIGMVTTLILPGRQTAAVANSLFTGFGGALKTAMGR